MTVSVTTAVYRCYDAGGALLYVGSTWSPSQRFNEHRASTDWWPQVTDVVIFWFDSPTVAHRAEAWAIALEEPRHNVKSRTPGDPNLVPATIRFFNARSVAAATGVDVAVAGLICRSVGHLDAL